MGTDRLSSFYKVGSRLSSLVSIMKFFTFLFFVGFSAAAYIKRDAEAEADPSGHITGGYSSAPVCNETPVRECKPRQIENPRKVCQTVYDTHEDTVVTEHCEEIVTTQCTQTSQSATQHSGVVDQHTRLVETGYPGPSITELMLLLVMLLVVLLLVELAMVLDITTRERLMLMLMLMLLMAMLQDMFLLWLNKSVLLSVTQSQKGDVTRFLTPPPGKWPGLFVTLW